MSLVPGAAAGSLDGLLHGIYGKDPETHRQTIAHGYISQAMCSLTCHVVEVWSIATNNGPQGNEAAVPMGLCGHRCGGRQLEGTGEPYHIDSIPRYTGLTAAGQSPLEEFGGDQLVVAAYQNRHSP